jgi:hypothetical protein
MRWYAAVGAAALALAAAAWVGAIEAGHIRSGFALSPSEELELYRKVAKNGSPSEFRTEIGAQVPPSVTLEPMPGDVAGRIPKLRRYEYIITPTGLVLVDPATRKVIDLISG